MNWANAARLAIFDVVERPFNNRFEPAVIHAGYQCKGICGCTFEGKVDGIKVTPMEHGEGTTGVDESATLKSAP